MRTILALVAVLGLTACGGSSLSPSAVRKATRWVLTGRVHAPDGTPIPNARLAILDGPNAGATAVTDGAGRYAFPPLAPGSGFTLQVSADGYERASETIQGAGNQTADVTLAPVVLTLGCVSIAPDVGLCVKPGPR